MPSSKYLIVSSCLLLFVIGESGVVSHLGRACSKRCTGYSVCARVHDLLSILSRMQTFIHIVLVGRRCGLLSTLEPDGSRLWEVNVRCPSQSPPSYPTANPICSGEQEQRAISQNHDRYEWKHCRSFLLFVLSFVMDGWME